MRIYTKVVIDMETLRVKDEESYEYSGEVALCSPGGGGGGPAPTTTVQKSEPWKGQKKYLRFGFKQAKKLYRGKEPRFFPDATYVKPSGKTQRAMEAMWQRGRQGTSPLLGTTEEMLRKTMHGDYLGDDKYLQKTIAGKYLNPRTNPWLAKAYDVGSTKATRAYKDVVLPGITSEAASMGRYGSGAWGSRMQDADRALAEELTGMATNIYGGNYEAERQRQLQAQLAATQIGESGRQRQLQAAMLAPQVATTGAALDWQNLDRLATVGAFKDEMARAKLADEMARWNFGQTRQANKLSDYMNWVQGNYGGTTRGAVTQPQQTRSPWLGALGGGLSGAGTGAMAGSMFGPWGTLIGAGAGGLLGAFGGGLR